MLFNLKFISSTFGEITLNPRAGKPSWNFPASQGSLRSFPPQEESPKGSQGKKGLLVSAEAGLS